MGTDVLQNQVWYKCKLSFWNTRQKLERTFIKMRDVLDLWQRSLSWPECIALNAVPFL